MSNENPPSEQDQGCGFLDVFASELKEIQKRRGKSQGNSAEGNDPKAIKRNLVGLALSGGGIRSATFCLGLLQTLNEKKVLHIFDYLSTVSGGGYVGGWWSAWLSRKGKTNCTTDRLFPGQEKTELERRSRNGQAASQGAQMAADTETTSPAAGQSMPDGAESAGDDPVHHLRLFANYLTPRKGALSQDTWRAIAVIIRNLLMTWLIMLPIIIGLILAGQLYFVLHPHPAKTFIFYPDRNENSKLIADNRWETEIIEDNDWEKLLARLPNKWQQRHDLNILRADLQRAHVLYQQKETNWKEKSSNLLAQAQEEWTNDFKEMPNQEAFHRRMLKDRLQVAAEPLIVIAGLIAVMVVNWLLLTLRIEKEGSRLVVAASLVAISAVVLCGFYSFPIQFEALKGKLFHTDDWIWKVLWLLAAILLSCYAWWPARQDAALGPTPDNAEGARHHSKKLWRRLAAAARWWTEAPKPSMTNDARRNRITLVHTRLLMLFVLTAVVLGIAGFGHEIVKFHFLAPGSSSQNGLLFKGSLFIILATLAGVIFTAYKTSPMGGGDKQSLGLPSLISQIIFAITPWLVVLGIAFAAAWAGHGVIAYMWQQHLLYITLPPFVQYAKYVACFGVAICFIFAMFEMEWQSEPTTARLPVSLFLATLIALCVVVQLFNRTFHHQLKLILIILFVIICVAGAVFILSEMNRKATKKATTGDSQTLRNRLLQFNWLETTVKGIIGISYLYWFSYEARPTVINDLFSGDRQEIFYAETSLLTATLTGGYILYRLILVRDKDENQPDAQRFKLGIFRQAAKGKPDDALWIAAAGCCVLAVTVSCAASALRVWLQNDGPPWQAACATMIWFPTDGQTGLPKDGGTKSRPNVEIKPDQPEPVSISQAGSPPSKPASFTEVAVHSVINAVEAGKARLEYLAGEKYALYLALPIVTLLAATGMYLFRKIRSKGDGSSFKKQSIPFLLLAAVCFVLAMGMTIKVLEAAGEQSMRLQAQSENSPSPPGLLNSFTLAGIALCLAFTRLEMKWGKGGNRRSIWLLALAYLILLGILIHSQLPPGHDHFRFEYAFGIFALLVSIFTWLIGFGWLANPNSFSMHNFYKWRLVRAYLGASNSKRKKEAREITEAAPHDDVRLSDLNNCQRGAPYHLISATLNLVAGRDLAIAQRYADSFLLSQEYCGSLRTNYRPTRGDQGYMGGQLTLGTAIAVSGAAASPNMGSRTPTSAMAMLMTLLNVRLGYWVPTPNKEDWQTARPRLWPFYLIREFLSQTNDLSSYCYLTDGGHFDNTGIYPLVMRGCRFIVAADCGADPLHSFSDLGDVIRRCRIDFGAKIELDIKDFLNGDGHNSKRLMPKHFIVGSILYSEEHMQFLKGEKLTEKERAKEERTGIIIIVKPSLTPEDQADVRQYALENPVFPHTTTTNQWFDESQFESYRRLGELCAHSLFGRDGIAQSLHHHPLSNRASAADASITGIIKLFELIKD